MNGWQTTRAKKIDVPNVKLAAAGEAYHEGIAAYRAKCRCFISIFHLGANVVRSHFPVGPWQIPSGGELRHALTRFGYASCD